MGARLYVTVISQPARGRKDLNARVGCVVLAAGEGRRLGGVANKLLLPLGGKPLLQHAIDAAAGSQAMSCTVVVGADAKAVLHAVDQRRCAIVENPRWRQGITTSIHHGLGLHGDDDACIFMPADHPFVTTQDLNRLIAGFVDSRAAIVALRAAGIWGTPMLFPRSDFRALLRLRGDAGAKRYAQRHPSRLLFVEAQRQDAFADVDTAADYRQLTQNDARN